MFHVKHSSDDTIAAIVTPLGVGGVGAIRISGKEANPILSCLFKNQQQTIISHAMQHGWIINPQTNESVDEAMVCFFKSPRSFTGEDVVELYCHGNPVILQAVLSLVIDLGARVADRGEFSKRAFLNHKMDLPQAEAILDLVSAKTHKSAGLAIQQLKGKLSGIVEEIKNELVAILAQNEAAIDFGDDVEALPTCILRERLIAAKEKIARALTGAEVSKLYRQGAAIVIVGPPNGGKSSLLNRILGEERAITSHLPGTTRDTIEEGLNIRGIPTTLVDTAGVRTAKDEVEAAGIRRTLAEAEAADLVLVVFDLTQNFGPAEKTLIESMGDKKRLIVFNKCDLDNIFDPVTIFMPEDRASVFVLSAKTGQGIDKLIEGIYSQLTNGEMGENESLVSINERHRECLLRATASLQRALCGINDGVPLDLISIEIKESVLALGEISGELVTDEIINSIFDQFCIGK